MNELIRYIFRIEFGSEFKLQWRFFLNILTEDLFVELQPSVQPFGVSILEAKEPDLTKTYGLDHLIKELLACGVGLDGKFELGIDGGDADVDSFWHDVLE